MRKFYIFSILTVLVACTSLTPSSQQLNEVADITDSIETSYLFNDSIDKIIKEASKVKVYLMMGLVRDSAETIKHDSLFNYPIEELKGEANMSDMNSIKQIVDPKLYRNQTTPIRQPFNPNYALLFSNDTTEALYFVSFGTGEIAISDSRGNFKFYLMRHSHMIDSLFNNISINN